MNSYYSINDRGSAVKEIKKYLYLISENMYKDIPRNTIDEIFDSETKAAVIKYQEIKGIEATGTVDLETFDRLCSDYLLLLEDINTDDYILSNGFPLKQGMINEDVRLVHLMINELRKTYQNIDYVGTGNYYSAETEKAVLYLRNQFGLEDGEGVDKRLYYRLKKELRARKLAGDIY